MDSAEQENRWPTTYRNVFRKMNSYPTTEGDVWNLDEDVVLFTRESTKRYALQFIEEVQAILDKWDAPHITLAEDGDYCLEWWGPGGNDENRNLTIYIDRDGKVYYLACDRNDKMTDNDGREWSPPYPMRNFYRLFKWMMEAP